MPAIKLGPGSNVKLNNVTISGFDVGIEGAAGSSVSSDGTTFHNVAKPWDFSNAGPSSLRGTKILNDPKLRSDGEARTSGWRRPKGPPLPLHCPSCGSISASQNYVFGGMFWELWNNEEQCPKCLKPGAKLAEGVFDLAREVAQIISAPGISVAMLRAIDDIVTDVQNGDLSPEDAIRAVEASSPTLSKAWKSALVISSVVFNTIVGLAGVGSAFLAKTSQTDELLQKVTDNQVRTEKTLEKMLERLPYAGTESVGPKEAAEKRGAKQNPSSPSASKSPSETGSIELKLERRLKARDLRRKADRERRRIMKGRSHPGPPTCS